jgi:hypothetical protein
MKNKTPIQQLMTELRELHPEFFDVHSDKGRQFLNNFHKYIAIEKEQIVDAFDNGAEEWTPIEYSDGQHYYNSTYGL